MGWDLRRIQLYILFVFEFWLYLIPGKNGNVFINLLTKGLVVVICELYTAAIVKSFKFSFGGGSICFFPLSHPKSWRDEGC